MCTDEFGNWDPGPLEPGERLVISTGEPREMAFLDYTLNDTRYVVSFREAAEVLTTAVMQRGEIHDLLVLPILYCYRHWLELQLKSIVALGQRWRDEPPEPAWGHDLLLLWNEARTAMEEAFPNDPADLDHVEAIVGELAELDPQSMSFRYSRDRAGMFNLPQGLARLNVNHFAAVILKVAILLDGAVDGMSAMLDAAPGPGDY